jgi:hypothetical protein
MDDDAPQTTDDETANGAATMPTWHANGSSSSKASMPNSGSTDDPALGDDDSAFLSELAKAMKTAATLERTRVSEDTDRRRSDHIAAIHARRDTEAERIRELAADDRKSIDAWAEAELLRIHQERDRRTAGLEDDLQKSLAEHRTRIDWEIERVEEAITSYRSEVDAFFASIDTEADPVAIARHASRRPAFPALDSLTAATASDSGVAGATSDAAGAPSTQPAPPSAGGDAPSGSAEGSTGDVSTEDVSADASVDAASAAMAAEPVEAVATGTETPTAEAESEPVTSTDAAGEASSDEPSSSVVAVAGEAGDAGSTGAEQPVAQESAVATAVADPIVDTAPETTGIGVMEPLSSQKLAEAWAAWNRSTAAADSAAAPDATGRAGSDAERAETDAASEAQAEVAAPALAGAYVEPTEPAEAEAVGAAAGGERTGPFSSGPGFARMSWLRRDKDHSGQ